MVEELTLKKKSENWFCVFLFECVCAFFDASVWVTLKVALFIQVSVWHCFGRPRLRIELWGIHTELYGA